jgi:AcrR family transcriptional regulator
VHLNAAIDGRRSPTCMSKAETIAALRDSATQVFSEVGYYGASLREIAAMAGVPLSTIHMYFGSKGALFAEVVGEVWREIEQERVQILAARKQADRPSSLRDVVYALAYPIVSRARSPLPEQRRTPKLLRHWVAAPPEVNVALRENYGTEQALGRWIDMLAAAWGPLSNVDAIWGFSYIVGAVYSWEMVYQRYDSIVAFTDDRSADEITRQLVDFAVAGLQGMGRAAAPCDESQARIRQA